jgi:glycogen synthase
VSRRLHVVLLGPVPPPEGGVARNVLAIRQELQDRGHQCSVIATTRSTGQPETTDIHAPRSAWGLLRTLLALKVDVAHLHVGGQITNRVLALAAATSVAARRSLLTIHSGEFPKSDLAQRASWMSFAGAVFRMFDRIICVNEQIGEAVRRFDVPHDRVRTLAPFTLPDDDHRSAVLPGELENFTSEHSPMLISVGGLEPVYDPLFQIRSFARVLKQYPSAGLLMVGGGSMQADVTKQIASDGLSSQIILTGDLPNASVLRLIDTSAVMIRATRADGDAISVREALALGTPVVASDASPRPEGAIVFQTGNEESFVAAVDAALRMGKQAAQPLGNDNICAMVDLYQDLCS